MGKYDTRLDVVKGIAIVAMVIAHASCCELLRDFIYLFHMPVFFICAGWLYKASCDSFPDVGLYLWKRLKRLWWPFVFWGVLCVATWNACFAINIYSNNPDQNSRFLFELMDMSQLPERIINVFIMRDGMIGMTGTFWFLRAMFFAQCGYKLFDFGLDKFKLNKVVVQSLFSFGLLAMCTWFYPRCISELFQWVGGKQTMIAYSLIHIGVVLHKFDLDVLRLNTKRQILLCGVSFFVLILLLPFEEMRLDVARYNHLVTLLIASLCGWYGLLALAKFVSWGGVCAYLGAHSLPIMILHFLAFKLVNLIGVVFRGDEICRVATFPVAYDGIWWCVAYVIVGVSVPLGLNAVWWKVFDFAVKRSSYAKSFIRSAGV